MALGFAQAPNKMNYQAVIRNSNNTVVSNHAIGMRISILQGTATGISVYTETQSPTTNTNGLIAIEIGTGTIISGSFANIDWANGPYFVKTETDPNGGTNYTLTGTSQLLSVPYALYAKKTDTAKVSLNGVPSGSQHGQILTNCDGNLTWTFNGQCPAKIAAFNCADTVHFGLLFKDNITSAPSCSSSCFYSTLSYSGGNGGVYETQMINSTGVLGLTATLTAGTLKNGNGSLYFKITGTPLSGGIATFSIKIGDKNCIMNRTVFAPTYQFNTVFCNGIQTAIINVLNPNTGRIWMDRNLGAIQTAASSSDSLAYGDLYQWGRAADGHQCRNSNITNTLSTMDQSSNNNFILTSSTPFDWRTPQNDNLWQGLNGTNNPCPSGYRIPTHSEFEAERTSWIQSNSYGAFNSPLKIPTAGTRYPTNGSIVNLTSGYYWTSTINGIYSHAQNFWNTNGAYYFAYRNSGLSVRCIKD
jgi:uncharacterized protein (TIGR02145 family)